MKMGLQKDNGSQIGLYPLGIGRKLNLHNTLKRRNERRLNVLCTLNVLPEFTG